ncbi:MAG: hypothetical protein BroJett022_11210 [Actinomycetes bacterium]|nr:MAG: hypothetical protein BroJett022_11210 [Actinomycetes bacterium]
MRLQRIELNGFRGFSGKHTLDLDANAVVVVGPNGQGKTSLFDGILWALTGRLPRLGDDPGVVSIYSGSGQARVELTLADSAQRTIDVVRTHDGERPQLLVRAGDDEFQGDAATGELLKAVWPAALHATDGLAALTAAVTRSVYLQQDLVREFIEADTEQDRFSIVSELVGAGRVTELAVALEKAKKAWSGATNAREEELRVATERVSKLEEQLDILTRESPVAPSNVDAEWSSWWDRARELWVEVDADPTSLHRVPEPGASEARRELDRAVRELDVLRQAAEQRALVADQLSEEIRAHGGDAEGTDLEQLRADLAAATSEVADARARLGQAEVRAAERRHAQVQQREAVEELRALAQLALRHLDGDCPVCGQQHDAARTRDRLSRLVDTAPSTDDDVEEEVSALADLVEQKEREAAGKQAQVRDGEAQAQEEARWQSERDRRLKQLNVDPAEPDLASALEAVVTQERARAAAIDALQADGERLALLVTRSGEQARRGELEDRLEKARAQVSELSGLVQDRAATGDLAGRILDALRDASGSVVASELERIEPVLGRVYATVDPHPSFRAVRLLTRVAWGRGRLNAAVEDPIAGLPPAPPGLVLSSSQMNALAVSMFLAMNLSVGSLPVQAAVLDDPLQSLDDVNLLGLVDLLRRTKERRQLMISTHDPRFGSLLERKLRPVRADERTRVIELDSWGRNGPAIRQRDATRDRRELRLVA